MENKYKIAFCGTPDIAVGILDQLNSMDNVEVVYAISQPDRKVGRKHILTPTPVHQYCIDKGIECLQPEKISAVKEQLINAEIDFLITCAFGQFIPNSVLEIPKIDALNIHGSLLPKYRGGAPIQYSIINGDKETGVSLMRMVKQMDAGPVFKELSVEITNNETSGTLFKKIELLGRQIIKDNLDLIATGKLQAVEQDESKATFAYNITTQQEEIDWTKSNNEIDCLIRGLLPRPIAHTFNKDKRFKIGEVELIDSNDSNAKPGQVISFDKDGIIVQTGSKQIKILEIQREGKKMLPANMYFNNDNLDDLKIGDIFKYQQEN